ncbi:hypothetical protein HPP92_011891 [Vanilla planifolia]|uniref:Uncharacterized protein n=1 Tax=Vanilla planifolia TaxID=51239 RepID=A0A835QZY3_VANPL|nr:hypothetical protein HPP92_011891 [Vanilla planifolia]
MQLMNVDGLTRENVASHLQKYRLYLKRMQGLGSSTGVACPSGSMSAADAATEQLFASNPISHPFLSRSPSGPGQETFLPFMSPAAAASPQIAAAAAVAQQQYYHQRQMGHFGSPTANSGVYDNGFHSRGSATQGLHRMGAAGLGMMHPSPIAAPQNSYGDDVDSGGGGGRRVLTLFPTGTED